MPVTHHVDDISDLDQGFVTESVPMMNAILSPWHQWLDSVKCGRHIDSIAALGASVVASAHGVALRGAEISRMLELLRSLPELAAPPLPGQADLETMVKALTEMPVDAAT